MFDQKLFKAQFTTGQTIRLNTADGVILDSCDANIGVLQGKVRTVPAILCDGANEDDHWKILNVVNASGMFLDHVAIKGAVSDEQASRLCHKYLSQARQGQMQDPVELTDNAAKTFLDSAKLPNTSSYIIPSDAALLDAQGTTNAVVWNEDNQLVSHGGRLTQMMLDMAGCDIQGNLLEQVSPRDVVAMLIDDNCQMGAGMFDAMILKYGKLDIAMQKMAEALKQSDTEEFFVKSVTPIEPFKRQGVVNVGAIFEMSDTQTITILFNNPDTTPSKLTGTDVLTSWKWILNKRDVTAILQPRAVDARKYPQIARRMHQVLVKNHDRFKRAQAVKNKDELLLAELVGQVEASQLELRTLQQKANSIQAEIDAETIKKQQQDSAIAAQAQSEIDSAEAAAKAQAEVDAAKAAEEAAAENQKTGITLQAGDFVTGKFAHFNKNDTVAEYREELEKGEFAESDCIVQKAVSLSPEEYDKFATSLLDEHEGISKLGGTLVDDPKKPREQRKYMTIVVAVMAQGRETLLVDPQGYGYARYVGLDPQKISAPQAFEKVYVDAQGEVQEPEAGADEAAQADEHNVQMNNDATATKKTIYAIKNPNPRAKNPSGTITLTPLEDGQYDIILNNGGVGGEFSGSVEDTKNWLTHRLTGMGEAMSDKTYTFADMASKLDLVIGDDVLGINSLPDDPYKNASFLDLSKGVVKELVALGWEKSGSTAIKNIEVKGEAIRLKFQFDPHRKDNEIWISRNNGEDNGESIGSFTMPELTEFGVKAKAEEMNALVSEYVNSANAANIQGDEFGEFDLPEDNKELRAAVKQALAEMVGKNFPCPSLNADVEVRTSGVKKIISTSADIRKLQAVAALKELLANAKKVDEKKPYDALKEQNIVAYHFLEAPLKLKDELLNVTFVIREDDKGHYHYDHRINSDVVKNAKSPLLDGLLTATFPMAGVSQDDLAKLIRLAGCELDNSIEINQGNVNAMLDSVTESGSVLNMFIEVVSNEQSEQNVQMNNEDEQFLNDVIAGSIDLLANETGDRLEKIGENLDESLTDLFNQAVDAYTVAALNNATSSN